MQLVLGSARPSYHVWRQRTAAWRVLRQPDGEVLLDHGNELHRAGSWHRHRLPLCWHSHQELAIDGSWDMHMRIFKRARRNDYTRRSP